MIRRIKSILRKYKFRYQIKKQDNIALLYHHVGKKVEFTSKFHSVTLSNFKNQIFFFKKHWKFVDEETFFKKIKLGEKGYVTLTFDDGYRDTFKEALPFLEENNIPYIFYINKKSIVNQFMWRDALRWIVDNNYGAELLSRTKWDIKTIDNIIRDTKNPKLFSSVPIVRDIENFMNSFPEVKRSFFELNLYIEREHLISTKKLKNIKIGNHSVNHYVLSTLSELQIQQEIKDNHKFIEEIVSPSKIAESFSVPFGSYETFNNTVIKNAKSMGYKYLFMSASPVYLKRKQLFSQEKDVLVVKRILPKNYA